MAASDSGAVAVTDEFMCETPGYEKSLKLTPRKRCLVNLNAQKIHAIPLAPLSCRDFIFCLYKDW